MNFHLFLFPLLFRLALSSTFNISALEGILEIQSPMMISMYPPAYYDEFSAAAFGKTYGDSGASFSTKAFDSGEATECLGYVCVEFIDSKQKYSMSQFAAGEFEAGNSAFGSASAASKNQAYANQNYFAGGKQFGTNVIDALGYGNVYGAPGQYYYPYNFGVGYSQFGYGYGLGKQGFSEAYATDAARAEALKFMTVQETNEAVKNYYKQAALAKGESDIKGYHAEGKQCKRYQCFHKYRHAGQFDYGPSFYGVYGTNTAGVQTGASYGSPYGYGYGYGYYK